MCADMCVVRGHVRGHACRPVCGHVRAQACVSTCGFVGIHRPVRKGSTYPVNETMLDEEGLIRAGSLSVSGSKDIIDVANAWIDFAEDGPALLLATLDWHPSQHCSFCYPNYSHSIPANTGCLAGAHARAHKAQRVRVCSYAHAHVHPE